MKYLPLLVFVISNATCYSQQPNPDLFQTWYLTFVQSDDLSESFNVVEIEPSITPTLTISSDLNFIGVAACNTYNGTFSISNLDDFFTYELFHSSLICDSPILNSFESSYFDFLEFLNQYQIMPQGQGLILTMYNPIFGQARFQNFSLKNLEFDSQQIVLYPNPTNSKVFIKSNQLAILKIQVINSIGQNVKTINYDFESINISDLSAGIYILKINTELGTINRKVVKE